MHNNIQHPNIIRIHWGKWREWIEKFGKPQKMRDKEGEENRIMSRVKRARWCHKVRIKSRIEGSKRTHKRNRLFLYSHDIIPMNHELSGYDFCVYVNKALITYRYGVKFLKGIFIRMILFLNEKRESQCLKCHHASAHTKIYLILSFTHVCI